jgi:hypothetical protein
MNSFSLSDDYHAYCITLRPIFGTIYHLKAVSFNFISAFLILLSQEVTNPTESRLIKVKDLQL